MTTSRLNTQTESLNLKGIYVCLIGLLMLAFAMLLRIEPSLMQERLLTQLHMTHSVLDDLMVRYQFTLIFTLLFAGYYVDFVGTRTTLILAVIVGTIGNYFFGNAQTLSALIDARLVIGFVHPFIFVGLFVLGSQWLPRKYFALFVALLFAVLLLTPKYGAGLIIYLLHVSSWRAAVNYINITGIVLAILLALSFAFIGPKKTFNLSSARSIFAILKNPKVIALCLISLLGWTANTFLFNWGAVYLNLILKFNVNLAIAATANTFISFVIGALVWGLVSTFFHRRHVTIAVCYFLAAICFGILVEKSNLSPAVIKALLCSIGFLTGAAVLCYAKAYDYCLPETSGFTFGLIACVTTGGNTLFAFVIGSLLEPVIEVHPTDFSSWQMPLCIIPIALMFGALLSASLRK
jgi:predicted MFS family arabinose efflux permease